MIRREASVFLAATMAWAACGGDDENLGPDAGAIDAPPPIDAGPQPSVARGDYLVNHVGACGDCHTPFGPMGPDMTRFLAGAECFIDVNGPAPGGCLHTRNLTNHATGLANRSDAEIKTMFLDGRRPNGEALVSVMPYWIFHNMDAVDADSIVMYLRTVPGVDHTVPASDPPWTPPAQPTPPLTDSEIPMPTTVDAMTMKGRYLATKAGLCIDCHTPRTNPMDFASLDRTKMFGGGEAFSLGIPGLPDPIYTMNLTPHATGIPNHTAAAIVTILRTGVDPQGMGVCPPMPAGPMGAFGGLTDEDAAAIAAYVKALPPVNNTIPQTCAIPPGP